MPFNIFKAAKDIANVYSLSDRAKQITVGTAISPGQPLPPQNSGQPPVQAQFPVGRNLIVSPRTEDSRLTPFGVLRTLAERHDITAMCWKMMIDQVTGDEWDIVPADKNDREKYTEDIETVKHFFWKPDRQHLFNDWLKLYLTDILQIDAGSLYRRRTYGGSLYALDIVDGSTIKPLIDAYGRVPEAPAAAYQQVLHGYPYGSSENIPGYSTKDIIYRPRYPRSWTPYGFAPTEQILMKINIMLRRDDFHLRYYTKGALPDAGLFQVDADWSPDQIQQYQELWQDVMAGNLDERLSMRFVPKGTYTATKEFKFDPKMDEWIARLVAISYGVNPQAFVMMMNRATGEMQDQQQTDIGLGPLEKFLADGFTDVIQNDLGFPHLRFAYIDEKKEDAQLTIERDMQYVTRGLFKPDEIRSARGLAPLTNRTDGVPAYILLGNDIVFLTDEFIQAKLDAQIKALEQGDYQTGNVQNLNLRNQQRQDEDPLADEAVQDEVAEKRFEKRLTKKAHDYAADLSELFDDLEEYMLERADGATDTELKNESNEAKIALLLLLLLSGYSFEEKFEPVVKEMLTAYAGAALKQAEKEIRQIGSFKPTAEQRNEIIETIVADRAAFLLPELEKATKIMIGSAAAKAEETAALKTAIENSYAVSDERAEAIAEIEKGTVKNITRIAAAKGSEVVAAVLVSDGQDFDGPCIEANGQVWSLDYAGANVLQHPRCVRQFTFLSIEEVEEHGGIDVE